MAFEFANAGGSDFGFVYGSEEGRVFARPALLRVASYCRSEDENAKQRQANRRADARLAESMVHIVAAGRF